MVAPPSFSLKLQRMRNGQWGLELDLVSELRAPLIGYEHSPTASPYSSAIAIEYGRSEVILNGPLAERGFEIPERIEALAKDQAVAFKTWGAMSRGHRTEDAIIFR